MSDASIDFRDYVIVRRRWWHRLAAWLFRPDTGIPVAEVQVPVRLSLVGADRLAVEIAPRALTPESVITVRPAMAFRGDGR